MTELKGMIGLEIHAYLVTKEKLFCKCINSRERGLKQNTNICPICTGQPGAKPMLPNKEAIKKAVMIGLMFECKINERLPWQRKHYNWPDMPKGFQSTLSGSQAVPVGENGKFEEIGIIEMHLEEDPASWTPDSGEVDYNRSGLPLVEIVTAPDFTTAEQVVDWLKKVLHSMSYLKAVDSNAGIKVDLNVNIPGKTQRTEIKNVNSLESIQAAINYELKRHANEEVNEKETRRFDEASGKTMKMRSKEGAADYRFITDPDLMPIVLDKSFVEEVKKALPEGPEIKLKKLITKYKIEKYYADILTKNIEIVEFFEKVAQKVDAKFALPWVTVELLRFLNYNKTSLDKVEINVEHFIKLLELVRDGKITPLKGKEILNKFYPKSFMPENVEGRIADSKELEESIKKVINSNTKAVEDYKKGEEKALNFLIGEVMKATQKRADFKVAKDLLVKLLT